MARVWQKKFAQNRVGRGSIEAWVEDKRLVAGQVTLPTLLLHDEMAIHDRCDASEMFSDPDPET